MPWCATFPKAAFRLQAIRPSTQVLAHGYCLSGVQI